MSALHTSDRFFIQHLSGMEATGIYAIGYKFGLLVNILVTGPFLLIWEPRRFIIAQSEDAPELLGQVFTYLAVAVVAVAVTLSIASKEIVQLLTDRAYWDAAEIIPFVAWGYVFFTLTSVVNIGLFARKKTALFSGITLFSFVVNMLVNYILIPEIGIYGAAISTLISFVIFFACNWYFSSSYVKVKIEWKKLSLLAVVALLSYIFAYFISIDHLLISLCLKLSIIGGMFCLTVPLGFYPKFRIREQLKLHPRAND